MKLLFVLFVFMLPFDAEFKASVDEDREVVRFVGAELEVKADVVLVVAVVFVVVCVDEAEDENEPLFAPVFTN